MNSNPEQHQALTRARLIWGLTVLTVVPLPFVAGALTGMAWLAEVPDGPGKSWNLSAVVIGLVLMAGGLFARNQAYKANWRGDVVSPQGYLRGNALLFSALAAAGLVAFGIGVWQGLPTAIYQGAIVLVGLLVFNFPNGKAMLPQPPRLGEDGEPW
ncbi:MAG: hypothetical protein AAGH88_14555 [Planctomycetota bacterium]